MNTDDGIKIIEYFKESIGEGITVLMFIQMISMLFLFFFIRYLIFLKIENLPVFKKGNKKESVKKSYIFGHLTIEMVIAFPIAYTLMILRGSDNSNYIWNMIISPAIGLVLSIFIDLKFIIGSESVSSCELSIFKFANKVTSKVKSEIGNKNSSSMPNNNLAPSISIQVNTGDGVIEGDKKNNKNEIPDVKEFEVSHLNNDLADSDIFNETIINSINEIIDIQGKHQICISNLNNTCNEVQETLNNMQEAEMRKYGISLKKKMYKCLGNGFITPQEYEEIEIEYENYIKLLKGNGQIKKLYEQRYSKLPIHEDRRKKNMSVESERRNNTPLCSYGEYDDECIEK